MDYLEYFNLYAEPFSHAPSSRFYYASSQHQEALGRLTHVAKTMKGLAVLIGDIGHGKTTLARRMLDSLPEDEFEAALLVIVHAGVTANWLLKRIAIQLGVESPANDKLEILHQLYERLVAVHKSGRKAVVLIDEAQMLGTRELMEEFRGLLNLELPGYKLISFLFFGLPELIDNLQLDPPLAQRVALRYELKPLGPHDTRSYVKHRLQLSGAMVDLFSDDAIQAVHRLSGGVPRVVNTLADNVLLEMFFARQKMATLRLVEAVAQSQGLCQPSTPELKAEPAPTPQPPEPAPSPSDNHDDAIVVLDREAPEPIPDAIDTDSIAARVAGEQDVGTGTGATTDSSGTEEVPDSQRLEGEEDDVPPVDIQDPLAFLSDAERPTPVPEDAFEISDGVSESVSEGVSEAVLSGASESVSEGVSEIVLSGISAAVAERGPEASEEFEVTIGDEELDVRVEGSQEWSGDVDNDAVEILVGEEEVEVVPDDDPVIPDSSGEELGEATVGHDDEWIGVEQDVKSYEPSDDLIVGSVSEAGSDARQVDPEPSMRELAAEIDPESAPEHQILPERERAETKPIKTSNGKTIDLAEIDDLLADLKKR